jgi:hypothetical protein
VLLQQERYTEAIYLCQRELTWCRQKNGNLNHDTVDSIKGLAIDLRESGQLSEAEALFSELLAGRR